VTNITFIFQTAPNAKPKQKKVGGHRILCPSVWKSGGDTSLVSPTKLRQWLRRSSVKSGAWLRRIDDVTGVAKTDILRW